jgi:hypothetical protein
MSYQKTYTIQVDRRRQAYSEMTTERIRKLDELGFACCATTLTVF